MEGINCQYGTYIIKISCTFAFDAVAELESSGGDGSLMSSASSTCAFFEPDWALAVPVEFSFAFRFLFFEPFVQCWRAAGPHSATVLVARLSASLSKTILVMGRIFSKTILPLRW